MDSLIQIRHKNSPNFRHWIEFLFGTFGWGGTTPTPPTKVQWLLRMGLFCALCYFPLKRMTLFCHSSFFSGEEGTVTEKPKGSKVITSSSVGDIQPQNFVIRHNHHGWLLKEENNGKKNKIVNQANWTAGESYLLKIFLQLLNWRKEGRDYRNSRDFKDDDLFSYLPTEFKWTMGAKGCSAKNNYFQKLLLPQKIFLTTNHFSGGLGKSSQKSVFIIDPQIFLKSLIRHHDDYLCGGGYHGTQHNEIGLPFLSPPAIMDSKVAVEVKFENQFLPKFSKSTTADPNFAPYMPISLGRDVELKSPFHGNDIFDVPKPESPLHFKIGAKKFAKDLKRKKLNLLVSPPPLHPILKRRQTENLQTIQKMIETIITEPFSSLENFEKNFDFTQKRKLYHLLNCQKEAWLLFERQSGKILKKFGMKEPKLRKKLEFLKNAAILYFQRLSSSTSSHLSANQPISRRPEVREEDQADHFLEILSLSNKKWLRFGLTLSRGIFGLWEKLTMDSFGISWIQPPSPIKSMLSAQEILENNKNKIEDNYDEETFSQKISQDIETELENCCQNFMQIQLILNEQKIGLTKERKKLKKKMGRLDTKIEQKKWNRQIQICTLEKHQEEFEKQEKIFELEKTRQIFDDRMADLSQRIQNLELDYAKKVMEASEPIKNGEKRLLAEFELMRREEEIQKKVWAAQHTKMREFITNQRKKRVGRVLKFFGFNF